MAYPDTSEVSQAIETGETQEGGQTGGDLAPDTATAPAAPTTTELDKLEKFKFEGQEYTPQELKRAILRQADYTRKTQEFSQERKFYDNLSADLRNVRSNPALAREFRRIYPEKFHQYLEYVPSGSGTTSTATQQPQETSANKSYAQLDPELISRFEKVENTIFEKEVQSIETSLEAQEKEFSQKYPMADLETVYSKAQSLLDRNANLPKDEHITLNKEIWDRLYKQDHDRNKQRYESYYKETINKQKQAGLKAKDSGLGGGSPGSSPKRHKTIKEATEAALSELVNT